MVTQEIREIINRFVEAVLSRGIHVDKAILYGSYATGKEGKDSDLDVTVISRFWERQVQGRNYADEACMAD